MEGLRGGGGGMGGLFSGGGAGGAGGGGAAESPSSCRTWGFPPLCAPFPVLASSLGIPENLSSAPIGTNGAMAPAFCTGVEST